METGNTSSQEGFDHDLSNLPAGIKIFLFKQKNGQGPARCSCLSWYSHIAAGLLSA